MTPTYQYEVSSMPFDLNYEDHSHQLFNTNHDQASSSLSCSTLYNPDQDQEARSYYMEPQPLQSDHQGAEKAVPSSGSWDHPAVEKDENYRSDLKLSTVWKKLENGNENLQGDHHQEDSSAKWMPLKIRMKRRLMVSDQTSSDHAIAGIQSTDEHKQENQKLPLPQHLRSTDNSSCNIPSNNNSNIPAVRVCADCNTTKTPLWRGGPRGPKTLCNACGIRQRKARRALAAASTAAANGATLMAAADQKPHVKRNHKLQIKGKKSKTELKKKPNLGEGGTKKLGSEELTISLSKSLALPQDEKDAAILLMALSHGLLHGFPSHRYLDL